MEITVNIRNFAYGNKVKDVVSVVQLCALAPLWEHDPNQLSFIRNGVEMTPGDRFNDGDIVDVIIDDDPT